MRYVIKKKKDMTIHYININKVKIFLYISRIIILYLELKNIIFIRFRLTYINFFFIHVYNIGAGGLFLYIWSRTTEWFYNTCKRKQL
jgi:hypothetical protein